MRSRSISSITGVAVAAFLVAAASGSSSASTPDRILGRAPAGVPVSFVVKLPLRDPAGLAALVAAQSDPRSPIFHHFITPKQFAASFGPTAAQRARIDRALLASGITIDRAGGQAYRVHATSAAVEKAFGVRMNLARSGNGFTHAVTNDVVRVPAAISKEGASVIGLENRIPFQTDSRLAQSQVLNRYTDRGDYWFDDLKQAYDFPSYTELDGAGVTIGIVMASNVLNSDTKAYFDHERFSAITKKRVPSVYRYKVEGGAPFSTSNDASFEASLDVQQSLGSAPGAQVLLYDTPDLADDSLLGAYVDIVEDNYADVISGSYGGCELLYTPAYNRGQDFTGVLKAFDALFLQGNSEGQTFLFSSGDSAGLTCPSLSYFNGKAAKFVPSVSFPASDPNVTAVGGTNLITTTPPSPQPSPAILTSKYKSESEYGDPEIPYDPYGYGTNVKGGYWGSGSGVSVVFPLPAYQASHGLTVSGRSVPDVSMQMGGCPSGISVLPCQAGDSASILEFGGGLYGVIGTSASSPEFAGLLALEVAYGKSRLGNVNPELYALATANDALPYHFFHDGIPGYNGVVTVPAGVPGYSQITGLGTPYAENMIGAANFAPAREPQTPSNP